MPTWFLVKLLFIMVLLFPISIIMPAPQSVKLFPMTVLLLDRYERCIEYALRSTNLLSLIVLLLEKNRIIPSVQLENILPIIVV